MLRRTAVGTLSRWTLFGATLCALWGIPTAALAQGAAPAPRLILKAMVNDVAPYSWARGDTLVGLHVELLQALSEQQDLDFKLGSAAYARLRRTLIDEAADVVVALDGADMDGQGRRVGLVHGFKSLVISRRAAPITTVAQLKGKTLGMARGAFYSDSINGDESIKKYGITDPFQGLRMLSVGRLDAVISSSYLLYHALRQPEVDPSLFTTPFVVSEGGYAMYARKDLPEPVYLRLQQGLERLHKSGRVATLLRAYE